MGYTGQRPSAIPLTTADIVDGTISNADLAGSITSAKITSLDATKLTGTVAEARLATLDSTKLTGSIADARVPASAVTQHVTATDTSKIENDIAILALHQAINENKSAYSLGNAWIEQFEDSTYVTALTNTVRNSDEFVSSVSGGGVDDYTRLMLHMDDTGLTDSATYSASPHTITLNGNATRSATQSKIGGYSYYADGTTDYLSVVNHSELSLATGDWTVDFWWYPTNLTTSDGAFFNGASDSQWFGLRWNNASQRLQLNITGTNAWGDGNHTTTDNNNAAFATGNWYHIAVVKNGTDVRVYVNGTSKIYISGQSAALTCNSNLHIFGDWGGGNTWNPFGYLDEFRYSVGIARWTTTFTPQTVAYSPLLSNATGNFTSTTITPQDGVAKTSIGLVLLYKNQAGTNTLNTDIICRVSADNGSNYTACVLAAKGTFSTGILIAVAPAVAVTSGTQLKYKVEFANQASGSKEARVHGVAMTY
jgi:hypothetical protein